MERVAVGGGPQQGEEAAVERTSWDSDPVGAFDCP